MLSRSKSSFFMRNFTVKKVSHTDYINADEQRARKSDPEDTMSKIPCYIQEKNVKSVSRQ